MRAQSIFVGRVPEGIEPGDELMVTVWPDGEADVAFRPPERSSWGEAHDLESRSPGL